MHKLRELLADESTISQRLKENALAHKNYKMYTSMDRALEFALTGELYLSDGVKWNDKKDADQMQSSRVYGSCFSFSTRENVAMWMLYGDRCGKNGAILNLPPTIIQGFLNTDRVEVVKLSHGKKAQVLEVLDPTEYRIFMTDVLYVDQLTKDDDKLPCVTYQKSSINTAVNVQALEDVFCKRYEWRYENETRLVLKPTPEVRERISDYQEAHKENGFITLRLHAAGFKKLEEDRIIHSPVYEGKVNYGIESTMAGEVNWSLNSTY